MVGSCRHLLWHGDCRRGSCRVTRGEHSRGCWRVLCWHYWWHRWHHRGHHVHSWHRRHAWHHGRRMSRGWWHGWRTVSRLSGRSWWLLEPWGCVTRRSLSGRALISVPGTVLSHVTSLVAVVAGPGILTRRRTLVGELAPMRRSAPLSRTVSSHVTCLVTVETLPGITTRSVSASSPSSIVRFLVVGFVGVRWGWDPLVSSQLVQTNTVGLLTEGVSPGPAWYSER